MMAVSAKLFMAIGTAEVQPKSVAAAALAAQRDLLNFILMTEVVLERLLDVGGVEEVVVCW